MPLGIGLQVDACLLSMMSSVLLAIPGLKKVLGPHSEDGIGIRIAYLNYLQEERRRDAGVTRKRKQSSSLSVKCVVSNTQNEA